MTSGPALRLALATSAAMFDHDEDGPPLLEALARVGVAAAPEVWDDEAVDWASYDAVVVRSTWDYVPRRDDYLAWAEHVETVGRLVNSAEVLRWNTDKTYLARLAEQGLPVVPTTWLRPGDDVALPQSGEYVVKPAVSAGSKDTNRYGAGHDELARSHVAGLLDAGRTAMVQPYLDGVDSHGETALLFFGGRYSHAIRKGPLLEPAMAFVEGAFKEEQIVAREPSDVERGIAEDVLDALPWPRQELGYARVDLVPSPGGPVLLELELTEPSMFLVHDGAGGHLAGDRFAAALARLVAP
jgi:glutathione synthase/RimK-type ligase-like ATP-grasp enzyme